MPINMSTCIGVALRITCKLITLRCPYHHKGCKGVGTRLRTSINLHREGDANMQRREASSGKAYNKKRKRREARHSGQARLEGRVGGRPSTQIVLLYKTTGPSQHPLVQSWRLCSETSFGRAPRLYSHVKCGEACRQCGAHGRLAVSVAGVCSVRWRFGR